MELEFKQTTLACMRCVVSQVRNAEQTQELKLGEGMPDVGRIIGAWGQPVLRSKEWQSDSFGFSGGMMIWVLYQPEGQEGTEVLSSWIPFQMHWELPQDTPEGQIRISCLARYVDARTVSPRKIMVRCGLSALGEAVIRQSVEACIPEQQEDVQLLINRYPLRIWKEAGEKSFLLDEEFTLPESAPVPEKLVCCHMELKLTDSRVLADKLAFRGTAVLHLLYRSDSGQIHGWEFETGFSQFAELDGSYGNEAQASIRPVVTSLEPELAQDGRIRLKCGAVAQYLISDREMLEVAEDAYGTGRIWYPELEELEIPVVLEQGRKTLYAEQSLPIDANLTVDARFLPEFPIRRRTDPEFSFPGQFQLLYYGADGSLQGASAKWEGEEKLPVHEEAAVSFWPQTVKTQAIPGNGTVTVNAELSGEYLVTADQRISMVKSLRQGDPIQPNPDRPSLIITRCAGQSLWQMAKSSGTTVEAICRANGLEGECQPDQLLMIPIP